MALSPTQNDPINMHGNKIVHLKWDWYNGNFLPKYHKQGHTITAINNWPNSTPTLNPSKLCQRFIESIESISLKIKENPNPCNKPINPVINIIFLCSLPHNAKKAAYTIEIAIVVSIKGINHT